MEAQNKQTVFLEIEKFLKESKNPLIAVMGPTASGKSSLAVEIAQHWNGEVINADSRQVYMEMEIGNELTKPEEMKGIPHHLFSFVPIPKHYSVAEYKNDAERVIKEISSRKALPIICGGTMLWIDAVVDNFTLETGEPDWDLRNHLESLETQDLFEQLQAVDKKAADELKETMNKRYIIRALEIHQTTGEKKSTTSGKKPRKYDVFKVAIAWDRNVLYERINKRTAHQFNNGMVEEVQNLMNTYANGNPSELAQVNWPSITSIGCKEVIPYLQGIQNDEETIELLRRNNRRYSKRQMTWLKRDEEIHWIDGNTI